MMLAMYRGPGKSVWHKIFHWAVCLVTRSRYSHCELVFGGRREDGTWLCASASERDGGVRIKRIDLTGPSWDCYEVPGYSDQDAALALQWFIDNDEAKYDWLGLFGFVLPIRLHIKRRWFCSEAIAEALGIPRPQAVHPQRLFEILIMGERHV